LKGKRIVRCGADIAPGEKIAQQPVRNFSRIPLRCLPEWILIVG
jgi:hypothetical protein